MTSQSFAVAGADQAGNLWILRRADLKILGNFGCGGHFPGCFTTPNNMATDGKGNIYVTESAEDKRVQRFLYKGLGPAQLA